MAKVEEKQRLRLFWLTREVLPLRKTQDSEKL